MRISLRHEITYTFERPASSLLRVLRVTPWAIECQHLDTWRIDVNCDCRLRRGDDAFGNIVDTVSADEAVEVLSVVSQGEVVTTDTAGILRNALERFPPAFYLRDTELTATDEALREFATKAVSGKTGELEKLHALLVAVCDSVEPSPRGAAHAGAIETLREGKGNAREIAHVFVAAARHIGAPARFVNGCLAREDATQDASHAWAEAHVPGIGWIGFDPTEGLCTHEGHVRIAIALDYLGAASVRSAPAFGVGEHCRAEFVATEARAAQSRQERSFGISQHEFQQSQSQR